MPVLESAAKMAKLAASAYRSVRSLTRTAKSQDSKEGPSSAVTIQNDSRMLYRRKRAPKKVRRRARKRYQRFLHNQLVGAADNTNLFQASGSGSSTSGNQLMQTITSGYTWCGTGTLTTDQVGNVYQAFQNLLNADPALTSKEWYLIGLSMDYTIANTHATTTAEVDIYEFQFRKDHEEDLLTSGNVRVSQYLENAIDQESKLPGATSKMSVTSLGYVPTDSNEAMKNILIKSKQRFYISPGQAISFTRRSRYRKPVKYQSDDFEVKAGSALIKFWND